jgi:hypothetical protein
VSEGEEHSLEGSFFLFPCVEVDLGNSATSVHTYYIQYSLLDYVDDSVTCTPRTFHNTSHHAPYTTPYIIHHILHTTRRDIKEHTSHNTNLHTTHHTPHTPHTHQFTNLIARKCCSSFEIQGWNFHANVITQIPNHIK